MNKKKYLKIIISLIIALSSQSLFADQFYDERPAVQNLSPLAAGKKPASHGYDWNLVKAAMYAFFVELDAFYPNSEIHFLARDAEYLYDISQIIYKGKPRAKQMKLTNVSTHLSSHHQLPIFLKSIGLTEARQDEHIVFVDSGYAGTVPKRIIGAMDGSGWKVHMMHSNASQFPTSNLASSIYPGVVGHMEDLPHFTQSGTHFILQKNGKFKVRSSYQGDKDMAKKLMRDLVREFGSSAARTQHKKLVAAVRVLVKSTLNINVNPEKLSSAKKVLKSKFNVHKIGKIVLDINRVIENNTLKLNAFNTDKKKEVQPKDFSKMDKGERAHFVAGALNSGIDLKDKADWSDKKNITALLSGFDFIAEDFSENISELDNFADKFVINLPLLLEHLSHYGTIEMILENLRNEGVFDDRKMSRSAILAFASNPKMTQNVILVLETLFNYNAPITELLQTLEFSISTETYLVEKLLTSFVKENNRIDAIDFADEFLTKKNWRAAPFFNRLTIAFIKTLITSQDYPSKKLEDLLNNRRKGSVQSWELAAIRELIELDPRQAREYLSQTRYKKLFNLKKEIIEYSHSYQKQQINKLIKSGDTHQAPLMCTKIVN